MSTRADDLVLSTAYDLVGIAGYKVGYEFYLVQVFGKATG